MAQEKKLPKDWLPLNETSYYILWALSVKDLHGYAILQEITKATGSKPGTTTLYRSIKNLEDGGLIEEAGEGPEQDTNGLPRRYYHLTALGRQVAEAERLRVKNLVKYSDEKSPGYDLSFKS